jgi:hypothetical protein
MTETRCKWSAEASAYLTPDGETCDVPKREHCTARRTCSQHLAWGELTCARCVGRTRMDLRQIVERATLLLPEAMVAGVNSEAANLAGPTTDPEAWSWRKVAAKQGRAWHVSLDEDDDETNPERVLTVWAQMLTEDYDLERPERWTLTNAAALIDRVLHRVAQDEDQDFGLMARELRRCRSHLESVLSDSMQPEKGAPCPTCKEAGTLVRLVREYPHYCEDADCCQIHVTTDELDVWVCPANSEHWWTPGGYGNLMDERKGA